MSQNDFNLANQGFPSFRSDLNSALQALASLSSGDIEPTTTYANQLWYESATNILHIRDAANSAWLDLMVINDTTGSPSFTSGNVGIGTSSPSTKLNVIGNGRFDNSAATPVRLHINNSGSNDYASIYADTTSAYKNLILNPNGGNVGIGTTADQSASATNEGIWLAPGTNSSFSANTTPLIINRMGTGGNDRANISLYNNGTARADIGTLGASNGIYVAVGGSEAMRIGANGTMLVGKTTSDVAIQGVQNNADGSIYTTVDGTTALFINRLTNDGTLVSFRQGSTQEGSISVSGTTVSYNGGHLSRWAQFPDNSRPDLLKGTVLSNLDQMSNWDQEDNEQLNCVHVSAVEGDASVAGVFVAWDSTDDGYNDILLAMTGDMIIRIAQGTTVQRGDLLMSAGDGTAKPQNDDIVRSKTIAKVISTHVTCTYDDGSYCVPCVLMAC